MFVLFTLLQAKEEEEGEGNKIKFGQVMACTSCRPRAGFAWRVHLQHINVYAQVYSVARELTVWLLRTQ